MSYLGTVKRVRSCTATKLSAAGPLMSSECPPVGSAGVSELPRIQFPGSSRIHPLLVLFWHPLPHTLSELLMPRHQNAYDLAHPQNLVLRAHS
jgi:hypothetical protein